MELEIARGEFVCIIGDVGSGKSSLLHALIGDMIYVPDDVISGAGGLEAQLDKEKLNELKKNLLSPDFEIAE